MHSAVSPLSSVTCLHQSCELQRTSKKKKQSNTMETGTVKWFNDAKVMVSSAARMVRTCLCISPPSSRVDSAACRRSAVQFDVVKGPKGWQAENVKAV